jgi:hypothetical protein
MVGGNIFSVDVRAYVHAKAILATLGRSRRDTYRLASAGKHA